MIAYNKVEDAFHSIYRIHSIISSARTKSLSRRMIIMADFIYCFPQYRAALSTKRAFGYLKLNSHPTTFSGSKESHAMVIEKSHWSSIRIACAKQILSITADQIHLGEQAINITPIPFDQGFQSFLHKLDAETFKKANDQLRLFEDKYETTA